jgi:hypothetical protein
MFSMDDNSREKRKIVVERAYDIDDLRSLTIHIDACVCVCLRIELQRNRHTIDADRRFYSLLFFNQ